MHYQQQQRQQQPQPAEVSGYADHLCQQHANGLEQQQYQQQYIQQYRLHEQHRPQPPQEQVDYSPGKYMIPVLGPFPNKPPMLLGSDFVLSAPTPVQWKTIMECVDVHDVALKSLKINGTYAANLDAAPVVAILENDPHVDPTSGTRYATLAAIVSVTSLEHFLDTSDASRFRDSLQRIRTASSTFFTPESKIRMVGVGRAQLSHFGTKHKDAIITNPPRSPSDGYGEPEDGQPILMARLNVVLDGGVASIGKNIHAQDPYPTGQQAMETVRSREMSEMSMWVSRINSLHADRQKLVHGLQAASARLENAANHEWRDFDGIGAFYNAKDKKAEAELQAPPPPPPQQQQQEPLDEAALMAMEQARREAIERELAHLFALEHPRINHNQPPPPIENTNFEPEPGRYSPDSAFQEKIKDLLSIFQNELYDAAATTFNRQPSSYLPPEAARLLNLPNFGMGYSETSFAPLDASTKEFVERLQPYYSYEQSNTEEFYYSTYSFVALHSLQTFLLHKLEHDASTSHPSASQPSASSSSIELLQAMKCTNTMQRLQQVYEWMHQHTSLLRTLAKAKSQELRHCGQECTDLW